MNSGGNTVVVKGLVTEVRTSGEKSKRLTVLSDTLGRITVTATGGNNVKASYFASTQVFAYSTLYMSAKNDRYILTEGTLIKSFYGISKNIVSFALAYYLASACSMLTVPGDDMTLRILLNSLYALEKRSDECEKIKAVFELAESNAAGFFPSLARCAELKEKEKKAADETYIRLSDGCVLCGKCASESMSAGESVLKISAGDVDAMRFLMNADPKKMFAFSLSGSDMRLLCEFAEAYFVYHLGKEPDTLKYYKETKKYDDELQKIF